MVNDTSRNETEDVTQYFYQVEQLTFLWILLTCIVIGNATVLVALLLSKGRKSRMNFFIKHLAAADLFVGLISVLTDIIWKITISWEAGLVACKIIRFLQAMVTYASTYVLVALSIDRKNKTTILMDSVHCAFSSPTSSSL
jgi:neuropeptide S receptor 1